MNYNYIINPLTGKKNKITSKNGINILNNYLKILQNGGAAQAEVEGTAQAEVEEKKNIEGKPVIMVMAHGNVNNHMFRLKENQKIFHTVNTGKTARGNLIEDIKSLLSAFDVTRIHDHPKVYKSGDWVNNIDLHFLDHSKVFAHSCLPQSVLAQSDYKDESGQGHDLVTGNPQILSQTGIFIFNSEISYDIYEKKIEEKKQTCISQILKNSYEERLHIEDKKPTQFNTLNLCELLMDTDVTKPIKNLSDEKYTFKEINCIRDGWITGPIGRRRKIYKNLNDISLEFGTEQCSSVSASKKKFEKCLKPYNIEESWNPHNPYLPYGGRCKDRRIPPIERWEKNVFKPIKQKASSLKPERFNFGFLINNGNTTIFDIINFFGEATYIIQSCKTLWSKSLPEKSQQLMRLSSMKKQPITDFPELQIILESIESNSKPFRILNSDEVNIGKEIELDGNKSILAQVSNNNQNILIEYTKQNKEKGHFVYNVDINNVDWNRYSIDSIDSLPTIYFKEKEYNSESEFNASDILGDKFDIIITDDKK